MCATMACGDNAIECRGVPLRGGIRRRKAWCRVRAALCGLASFELCCDAVKRRVACDEMAGARSRRCRMQRVGAAQILRCPHRIAVREFECLCKCLIGSRGKLATERGKLFSATPALGFSLASLLSGDLCNHSVQIIVCGGERCRRSLRRGSGGWRY